MSQTQDEQQLFYGEPHRHNVPLEFQIRDHKSFFANPDDFLHHKGFGSGIDYSDSRAVDAFIDFVHKSKAKFIVWDGDLFPRERT